MTGAQPILQLWTAPKCQADAEALYPLTRVQSRSIIEALGAVESGNMVVTSTVANDTGIAEGHVIRALLPLQPGWVEWIVLGVEDDGGDTASITLGPIRRLLGLRGRIREASGATTTLTFAPARMTAEQLLELYVLTNLEEDDLDWLSVGDVDSTETIELPEFTAWTRDDLLKAIEKATNCEFILRALDGDCGYALDLVSAPNSDVDSVLLETRGGAVQIRRTRDLLQTGTVIMPLTGDGETMGEVDWLGGTASGSGPYWIPLTDPVGGPLPVREDDQFIGRYLGLPDGTALAILDSRVSDSAVQVASLGTYVAGQSVAFWENTSGRPLATIESPQGLASSRGRVVATARVAAATAERNLIRNSGFQNGRMSWTDVNGTGLSTEIARTELGLTLSGLINGFRAAATGTGTALGVDGLPADTWIRKGDQIMVAGGNRGVAADSIPDASGGLALTIDAPGLPGALPDGAALEFTNLDLRLVEVDLAQTPTGPTYALRLRDVNTDGAAAFPFGAYFTDSLATPTWTITPTSWVYVTGTAGKVWAYWGGGNTTGAPPGTWTDGQIVALVIPRGVRTLLLDGPHVANATSLAFQDVPAIASHAWTTADSIAVERTIAGTAAITAAASNGDGYSFYGSYNAGTSTLDDVADVDRNGLARVNLTGSFTWEVGGSPFSGPSLPVIITAMAGGSIFWELDPSAGIDFGSVTAVSLNTGYTQSASYTLSTGMPATSTASFGPNGRVALPVSIPAGSVIARGAVVTASWGATLYVHTAVTGPAASIELAAWDEAALYRAYASGGYFAIPGEIMTVATSVQAGGAGAASVVLTAANTNAVADNAAFTITRQDMLDEDDRTNGSVLRPFYAPGTATPTMSTPGVQSASVFVSRPGQLTARAWWAVTPDTLDPAGSAPRVAIVNLTTNTVLASESIDTTTSYSVITELPLTVQVELPAAALIALRVYGGSSALFSRWHVLKEVVLFVGDRPTIAYFEGAGSRIAHHRGQDTLEVRKSGARYEVRAIDQAYLDGAGSPLVKGQRVRLRDTARGIDTTQRIEKLSRPSPGGELVQLECGALVPLITDVDVSL